MLTPPPNKMLTPDRTKAGLPPPDAPRGRCPACNATGPLVVDRRGGKARPVVLSCTCLHPPTPEGVRGR